ncbi:MAG: hypothetical protein IJU23_09740 [Proteobacteria bacterium]|nr:hypothetical protein [Pseudomonadota bacterium]
MQYLSWADVQIPLCFVTGLSYAKRAKVIEHTGGYVSTRGFEAAEMSVQVQVTRAACMAFGLDFDEQVMQIRSLIADKDNPSGGVTVGGYPLYPELQFALTNVNTTYTADSVNGISVYACDLVLSGVACTKKVCRNRALEFDPETEIPVVSIRCNGKKLILQDGNQISGLVTSPNECQVECVLGEDVQTASRKGFIEDVIEKSGTIEIDLPSGMTAYNIISASLNDNILSMTGSILPEGSAQAVTMTFRNKDISEVIDVLLKKCGSENHVVKISGKVDYFLTTATPMAAIEALQDCTGFVASLNGNRITVAWLPDAIDGQKAIDGDIIDDETNERISKIIWKDGLHEFEAGSGNGEHVEVNSCFSSPESAFCERLLERKRYDGTYIAIEGAIDREIGHHSQVYVEKDGEKINCLVDFYQCDWVNNIARYECRYLR